MRRAGIKSLADDPSRPARRPAHILEHALQTLSLAVPVMLARAGLVIIITVDTLMSGAAGGDTLAYYGASLGPHITMLTIGIGLLTGTVVFTAQMAGADRPAECGRIWRRALMIGCMRRNRLFHRAAVRPRDPALAGPAAEGAQGGAAP